MAAAGLPPLPVAPVVLVVLADLVFSLGHLDRLGLPERECVDRAGGPAPARGAMTVASALRIPRDFNRDGAAVALPFEGPFILAHEFSVRSRSRRDIAQAVSRPERCFPCEGAVRCSSAPSRETQASQAQAASQYGGLAAVPGVLSPLASRKLIREDADAGHHLPHVDLARRFRRWARPEPR